MRAVRLHGRFITPAATSDLPSSQSDGRAQESEGREFLFISEFLSASRRISEFIS